MILIEEIKTREVTGDCAVVLHYDEPLVEFKPGAVPMKDSVKQELVYPQYYKTEDGEPIQIGMPRHIQEILGIPFEAVEVLKNQNDVYHREICYLKHEISNRNNEIHYYMNMGIWNFIWLRIKKWLN